MKKSLLIILCLFFLSVTYANEVGYTTIEKPMLQNDIHLSGQSNYSGPMNNSTLWINSVPPDNSFIDGSTVIGNDGVIYYPSSVGVLYAYYPNGSVKWNFSINNMFKKPIGIETTPIIDKNNNLYLKSRFNDSTEYFKGILFALDEKGNQKWNISFNEDFSDSSPIIEDSIIYLSNGRNLYAIDSLANILWTSKIGSEEDGSISTPSILNDEIFVTDNSGHFYSINKNTGAELWKFKPEVDSCIFQSPVTIFKDKGYYLLNSFNDDFEKNLLLFVMDLTNQKMIQTISFDNIYAASGPSISKNGNIYISARNFSEPEVEKGNLISLNNNLKELWNLNFDEGIGISVTIDKNENIYFGSEKGTVFAYDKNGIQLWNYTMSPINPEAKIFSPGSLSKNGTFYISSKNIGLFAFNQINNKTNETNSTNNTTTNETNNEAKPDVIANNSLSVSNKVNANLNKIIMDNTGSSIILAILSLFGILLVSIKHKK